ncbi:MAG: hypothetical protein GSR84_03615 [Desulfurococcales archaeon]|nr:hypothetical protein [Desulfurococcales archaeon]
MPRASVPILMLALLLIPPPAHGAPTVEVYSEPPLKDLSLVNAEVIKYRGRYYPKLAIHLPSPDNCSDTSIVEVWKGQLNITELALGSGSARIDSNNCILEIDGARLRGIMYLDGPPIIVVLDIGGVKARIVAEIGAERPGDEASGNGDQPGAAEPINVVGSGSPTTRSTTPTEVDGGFMGSPEILVGITLAVLLAVSVVYEYGLGRGGRVAESGEPGDDLRRR